VSRQAEPDTLAGQILASAKYRHLDEAFVRRVAAEAAGRFRDHNEALKYARRKLHQAFGAYLTSAAGDAVRRCVTEIQDGADARAACRAAMRAHASTAERLPWLDPFYERVSAWCGLPESVVDLACGLGPLAIPWLAPGVSYWCCDIDRDLVAALGDLGAVFPVAVTAATRDLLDTTAALPAADLAMLLKTVTTLDQQRAGAGRAVLAALDCPQVVLSVPRRSLSGRRSYVDDPVAAAVQGTPYRLDDQATFGDELVCHLVRA
jgi:16S rRNA (guanine(1405)-N(7))-methyltransferase